MHAQTRGWKGAALALVLGSSAALAHHGWSNYDADKAQTLKGTVQAVSWEMPHGHLALQVEKARWDVVLAPPSRMEGRGLKQEALTVGKTVEVMGYPHRTQKGEMRAERITVDGKTVELR
jgi:Family of unknown function (DUF6152)